MASKTFVDSLVDSFAGLDHEDFKSLEQLEEIRQTYYRELERYTDAEVGECSRDIYDQAEFFDPGKVLHDIKKRLEEIHPEIDEGQYEETEKEAEIQFGVRCRRCGYSGACIKDPREGWLCRECYTGLTYEQIKGRFQDIQAILEGLTTKEEVLEKWGLR